MSDFGGRPGGLHPAKVERLTRVGVDPALISLTKMVLKQNEAVLKMNAGLLRDLGSPQYLFELVTDEPEVE